MCNDNCTNNDGFNLTNNMIFDNLDLDIFNNKTHANDLKFAARQVIDNNAKKGFRHNCKLRLEEACESDTHSFQSKDREDIELLLFCF